ncbi:3-keto-disaccharide hydrolase [Massilia sp. DD77]|uniref:3-keto-disaccharide hydrolase n=1 Tax=Massilia sp. DD77 TaxID=3109349 RepID=UPI002FFE37CB
MNARTRAAVMSGLMMLAWTAHAAPQAATQTATQAKPEDTEVWKPEPRRVTPALPTRAPSDAIVLFDGKGLGEWVSAAAPDKPAAWTVADGAFSVRAGSGDIETRRAFLDYQLHLEWRAPSTLRGRGQERGNSGVFLASTGMGTGYEIQVLDCAEHTSTYANGQAASLYKQHIPLVNACAAPGEWQAYDIIWTAPRFKADGSLQSPAYVTALHNGVLVQHHVALRGETMYIGLPSYRKHGPAPIRLQDHGDPVSFRNIWVRPLN